MCLFLPQINYERAAPGKEPTEYHMIPKFVPKGLEPIRGKPIMVYGPALPRWREVARDVYAVYKADRKITKGSPTGGWARMVSLAESGLCSRLDIYGAAARPLKLCLLFVFCGPERESLRYRALSPSECVPAVL